MKLFVKIYVLFAAVSCMTACDEVRETTAPVVTRAWLNCNSLVKGYDTSCALMINAPAGTGYTATVSSEGDWCLLSNDKTTQVSETLLGRESMQWIYFPQNVDNEAENYKAALRHAVITVKFDNGYEFELPLRQTVFDAPADYDKPWNELPKYVPNDNYIYQSYSGTLQNRTMRNYTLCLDKTKYAALWVAYPLHTVYTAGPANRNNSDFGFDPDVLPGAQANLIRSYGGPYDRGHQLPAADRKCDQMFMNQTFYATNMTPQYYKFNQGVWGRLEGGVRGQVCADTLYVVTGAYFDGVRSSSIAATTTDSGGKSVPTPTHYYKILLRTVSGATGRSVDSFGAGEESQIKAIGVWLEHNATTTTLSADAFVPVSRIEELTGFSFFNMLDPEIAGRVKSQCNPSAWTL